MTENTLRQKLKILNATVNSNTMLASDVEHSIARFLQIVDDLGLASTVALIKAFHKFPQWLNDYVSATDQEQQGKNV
jgi:predicted hydrolase (HD superfamily)